MAPITFIATSFTQLQNKTHCLHRCLLFQFFFQALQAAHMAEALHADYLLEWMRNISNDLTKLENDAAPPGWKCLWNRYVTTIELYSMYLLLH